MKKIKILHTIRQGKIGGGESHVLDLVTHMDQSKFESIVLAFTDGPMVESLKKRGITTEVIYTEKPFNFSIWKQVTQCIKRHEIDLVHAHGTRAFSNVFYSANKLNIPIIYTVHGWSFHPNQPYLVQRIREKSERFLTARAHKTICVSKSNQQSGISRLKLKRSVVIYNAVNLEKFSPQRKFKDLRKEFGIDKNKIVIGYIVRMTAQKDPFTMLKAMQKICESKEDIILLMVGDGELKSKAIQLAKNLKIEDRVIFESFRTDIPDVLNAIDVYCLPSLWEGFPIGIIEAMAMHKPVVVTPVDGSSELVTDRETGLLVETKNEVDLAQAVIELNDNPALRNQIIVKASEFVNAHFGISQLVQKVEDNYIEVLN